MDMDWVKELRIPADGKVKLAKLDAAASPGLDKEMAALLLERNRARLARLGYRLYAEGRRALLVILQGMDAAGKDGVVRHVMTGLNPQNCRVTSFKAPTAPELARDFLWRIHQACPAHGEIGVFNRSHYEDVLIARVRNLVPEAVWKGRYRHINAFEELLATGGTAVVKIFLHISKEEQRSRLQTRLDDPEKNWKFTTADVEERRYWEDYWAAYEDAIGACNAKHAPWYLVPADKKWYRNAAVSQILVETQEALDLQLPAPREDLGQIRIR
jgi:PPK2 family polyphosphate:nucleotide phosphotransferase